MNGKTSIDVTINGRVYTTTAHAALMEMCDHGYARMTPADAMRYGMAKPDAWTFSEYVRELCGSP